MVDEIGTRPGLVVLEDSWMRYLRLSCTATIVLTPAWWFVHRMRLKSVDARVNYRLHHVALRASSYSTAFGFGLGTVAAFSKALYYQWDIERVVIEAVSIRCDKQVDLYNKMTARCGVAGLFLVLPLTEGGGILTRSARGFGLGVVAGIPAAYYRLDTAFSVLAG